VVPKVDSGAPRDQRPTHIDRTILGTSASGNNVHVAVVNWSSLVTDAASVHFDVESVRTVVNMAVLGHSIGNVGAALSGLTATNSTFVARRRAAVNVDVVATGDVQGVAVLGLSGFRVVTVSASDISVAVEGGSAIHSRIVIGGASTAVTVGGIASFRQQAGTGALTAAGFDAVVAAGSSVSLVIETSGVASTTAVLGVALRAHTLQVVSAATFAPACVATKWVDRMRSRVLLSFARLPSTHTAFFVVVLKFKLLYVASHTLNFY